MPKESALAKRPTQKPIDVQQSSLRSVNEILGYKLLAAEGGIGSCQDFLFDDEHWTVRFVVVDTGKWLPGKRVVVSPVFLDEPDWEGHRIPVALTRKEIEECPEADEHAPVSRQYEIEYYGYHGLPGYWWGGDVWGAYGAPYLLRQGKEVLADEPPVQKGDPHLRAITEVKNYRIETEDEDIGHVEDFILEIPTYVIRYLVVETRKWLPGKRVLLSPLWVDSIRYADSKVKVDLSAEQVKNSPEFDPTEPVNRKYEAKLYDYYGRPKWWV